MQQPHRQHLSAGQAARILGAPRETIQRALRAGRIPATKGTRAADESGAPRWRIHPDAVLTAAAEMRLDIEVVRARIAEQLKQPPASARAPARLTDAERLQLAELLGERR
jgi:excisionase family DNA binding protein